MFDHVRFIPPTSKFKCFKQFLYTKVNKLITLSWGDLIMRYHCAAGLLILKEAGLI